MNFKHRAALQPRQPLARSHLKVEITDLLAEYELRHVFRNTGDAPIEAVYSFPVPLDAAFLGMEATLGGEVLSSQVQLKSKATRRYDDAIANGDSAVLLEAVEPGMLCVSLGNLLAKEKGEIVLRFAATLSVADRIARFSLPLVHRPRYGRSALDALVEPHHDFSVEHPLDVDISVRGLLAKTAMQCAAHGVRFSQMHDAMVLRIDNAMLDRDFVLGFELPEDCSAQARLIADGEEAIGLVSFTLPQRTDEGMPLDLCLVLDGSGSMQGDAIAQSRLALDAVAATLGDADRVQVLRFGSRVVPLFRRPLLATARVREALHTLTGTVNADLGGTEIGAALDAAMDGLQRGETTRSRAIILVTDGAVTPKEIQAAQARAVKLGIRIFVVAVGSSAGVDVLAPLAAATRAVLERAVPAEPVDAGVMRQFRRAREPAPPELQIDWGSKPALALPPGVAYSGDAVIALAFLSDGTPREITVRDARSDTLLRIPAAELERRPAWRAWAGQQAYRAATGKQRATLALRYELITEETSAVLVKVRAESEKADGMPRVVPVAHMVPEGMVVANSAIRAHASVGDQVDYLDIPCFLRRQADDDISESAVSRKSRIPPPPPLSKARIAEIRLALRLALDDLLLGETNEPYDFEALLQRIDVSLRADTRRYLDDLGKGDDAASACDLLHDLASASIGPLLTDEQEARLAVAAFT